MSEHLLKILLTDLQTVRLVCKGVKKEAPEKPCGAVFEFPVAEVGEVFPDGTGRCPFCGIAFQWSEPNGKKRSPFVLLAEALEKLKAVAGVVDVQFISSVKEEEKG
jgi:hypothetical protein